MAKHTHIELSLLRLAVLALIFSMMSLQYTGASADDVIEDEPYAEEGEGADYSGVSDQDSYIFNAIFGMAVVFDHPNNGRVFLYPSNGGNYLMRSNTPSGQPLGEGGKWHVEQGQLCIDTAIKYPPFASCAEFRVSDGRNAEWDHPFAVGLPITIMSIEESKQY